MTPQTTAEILGWIILGGFFAAMLFSIFAYFCGYEDGKKGRFDK